MSGECNFLTVQQLYFQAENDSSDKWTVLIFVLLICGDYSETCIESVALNFNIEIDCQ